MPKTNEETLYLECDEAIKEIKRRYRRGVTYFVKAGCFLYTQLAEGDPKDEENYKPARGYEGMSNIKVSQKDAIHYVEDNVGRVFKERGVKVRIYDSGANSDGLYGCIFIG